MNYKVLLSMLAWKLRYYNDGNEKLKRMNFIYYNTAKLRIS